MNKQRLALFAGIRTPFGKAGSALASYHAEDLGALVSREILLRTGLDPKRLDAVIVGNVGQQARAANIARIIALRAGVPERTPAYTVHRNCASGLEAVTQAALLKTAGRGKLFLTVGTESMSNYPLTFGPRARSFFQSLSKARKPMQKLGTMLKLRPSMFQPEVALLEGLTDPIVGLGMGETAELLAREWNLTREMQDAYAASSHSKALAARARLREETCDVVFDAGVLRDDEGVRSDSTPEKLAKLRAVFARAHGTVTAGNASQISDGAVALLVGEASLSKDLGLVPLAYLDDFAYAGCDPSRMGLGPVYAMHALFPETTNPFESIDLVEINEAFAAQVLACLAAVKDASFCRHRLGRDVPLGAIPEERLNVNGGSIALGHPVGASGARLLLTTALELARRGKNRGLVSLCVGGGQGAAALISRS